jgi:hypothetical protein
MMRSAIAAPIRRETASAIWLGIDDVEGRCCASYPRAISSPI